VSDDVRAHEIAEQRMAAALRESDPVAALVVAAADPALTDDLRAAFAQADPDGVRMAALLIVKLRFERLIRGSDRARAWFEREPEAFADAFRRYHAVVAPTAFWPSEEAACFDAWTGRQRDPEP
jgi:hypothetical protein